MSRSKDVRVVAAEVAFIPATLRVPLKFGSTVATHVTCARVKVIVRDAAGREVAGWGETPLSENWGWPSPIPIAQRHDAFRRCCSRLAEAWARFDASGHPVEIGQAFLQGRLDPLLAEVNAGVKLPEPMPHLAGLICCSAFDIAVHDAYGNLHGVPVYQTYNSEYMNQDLSAWLEPADQFESRYPADFLVQSPPARLPAWHLVGGLDLLDDTQRTGSEPNDGYPVTLDAWIRRDGLKCLKIKLRGNDNAWDYQRIVSVGSIAVANGVDWLTTDFNCTVNDPAYVNEILDRLLVEHPRLYGMILYVEQPFPYDLEAHRIDVHSVSARKPLFMDESAHDWHFVQLGRSLGWTGVALKTCKTQTGALLSLCWAKAHGMTLMVQDLTNPMLAQIPHCLLAAHAGTIMGVETNAMQFYPEASKREAKIHPGLYQRRGGAVDLSTIRGPGFGYRLEEIEQS